MKEEPKHHYICPFFPGQDGMGISCYREKCMAWREIDYCLMRNNIPQRDGYCLRLHAFKQGPMPYIEYKARSPIDLPPRPDYLPL